jgi:hypothetical protein
MKCDKVLSALASRGSFGRWRARRHAARCPRCATVANELGIIVEELSAVPLLTAADRQLWLSACENASPLTVARPHFVRPAFVGAVAALILLSMGTWLSWHSVSWKTSPTVVLVVDPEVAKASSLREVDEIRTGVVALVRELDQLRREADLLDARRDADALELRFTPRTALNGF